ncbi:MAG TPA: hypothetical protein PK156_17405 [Polyangium sp.]|nr:hypothetical protein [Polyangium sp.]
MGDAAEKLYEDAIKLPLEERRKFALRLLASTSDVSAPTSSWETLDSLRGIVRLGGNAVEDCERLYDG